MSRVQAGHGSDGLAMLKNTFGGNNGGSRTGSMLSGINNARMHVANLEHDKWKTTQGHAQEERMAVVHHVLGEDAAQQAHGRQEHFVNSIVKHSAGGTPITLAHGDASATFVRKQRKVTAAPVAETPRGPQLVGMPLNIATAGTPAAPASPAVAQPKPPVLMANHPVTGSLVRRDSLSAKELATADAKRAAKSNPKKATAKRAATKKKK